MKWFSSYIGLPYKPHGRDENGLDCWGLVRLVYRDRFNIELNDLAEGYCFDRRRQMLKTISGTFEAEAKKWQRVETPQEYVVSSYTLHGFVYHVGIVVSDTHMIHVEGKEGVVLQPFKRKDLYGFYRYC